TIYGPGVYWVNVTNACGSRTDSVHVYKDCDFQVYMPSGFTPNGDGKNDVFRWPAINKDRLVRLSVYDRWGTRVFSSSDPNQGWDGSYKGQAQPAGTYVYYLEVQTLAGQQKTSRGTIMLVR
ncbi:MAG TPA: gliding motility-associated C-terminal domain-containing protein, partial [Puia sp.]|nr:gliding motility-associated C-terminal domain-containing protein [Puia sp.]